MVKRVLFVCTGNSARSQMAEGLLRHAAGDRFEVHSAGTQPKGLSPYAVAVMREMGVDISHQRSKSVDEYVGQRFDYVITVCDSAKQACPAFPGKARRLHWEIADPAAAEGASEEVIEAFRAARDELCQRVEEFALTSQGPAKALMRLPWRKRLRLFGRLLTDARVPLVAKLTLPAAALYLVIPLDVIPDFVPLAGYLDDVLVVVLGLSLFLRLCPEDLFWEHVRALQRESNPGTAVA